jgi:MOSC domain-containing protein YiiM
MRGAVDQKGVVVAVSLSESKGERKRGVECAQLIEDWGLEGDAHAGPWQRQVSLLAQESINQMHSLGLDVGPGDFAENITTQGLDLPHLRIGDRLRIGAAELQITQIGKECHARCEIYRQAGDCVMPRDGVFARVIRGGRIKPGDTALLLPGAGAQQPQPAE